MLTKRLGLPHIQGAGSFITALFIDALGSGLFWPFSLLYFHVIANLPLSVIGLVLAIATLISLPMTPVTGILVDRVGTQRIIVASQLLEVVGFLGYLFVRTVPVLLITALLVAIGIRMFWVAFPTLIAEISPEGERDRWYGFISAAQNAGLGMGGLLAGVLIALGGNLGYQVLVAVNALSFLVSAALLSRLRGIDRRGTQQRQITETVGYRAILQDRPFLGIVVCNTAFILCISTATSALPVYLIEALHMPAWIVGIAFTLNTVLLTGLQTFVVRLAEPHRRTRVLVVAGLVWIVSCALLALALVLPQSLLIPYILIVVSIYTFGELLQAPTASALVVEASPEALQGRYVATYQLLAWGVGTSVAPALFTALFTLRPAYPWAVLAGLMLIAILSIFWLEPRLPDQAVRTGAYQAKAATSEAEKST